MNNTLELEKFTKEAVMSNHGSDDSSASFSRRSLLLGVGGGAALSLLGSSGMAQALGSQTTSPAKLDPEAARVVNDYLGARARVTAGGNLKNVLQFINPDRRNLIDFESARFGALSTLGSANRWNGAIDRVSSEPQIISAVQSSSSVHLLVQDWTAINWRPAPPLIPFERTPEEWALVRKDPVRYGLNVPSWRPTDSGFGTTHLVTLENNNGRWLITQDGYDESNLAGSSPDYSADLESQATSQASRTFGSTSLRAKIPPPNQNPSGSGNLTTHTFDYHAAISFAYLWWNSYNPGYPNWGPNADCANFVSQSFVAGAYPTDGTWYVAGSASYAWVNNVGLRDWLISSGRGHDETASMLGLADCVNYDWDANGLLDHIALVTDIVGGVPLVTCHSAPQLQVPYNQIYAPGYMPSQIRKYTGTYLYYSA